MLKKEAIWERKSMTLQQLRQIITIAETGSMNEAAKKLFVAQPSLSSAVKDVEEEIWLIAKVNSTLHN